MIARAPSQLSPSGRPAWVEVILWAAYLACSWTWCIGMFLPVLLVRDYGIMGWVVFAIPNVIGAAAMGWVLRDGMSERIARDHARAIEWFRLVTVVFQLWFLVVYLMPPKGDINPYVPETERILVLCALVAGMLLGIRIWLGVPALAASLICATIIFARSELKLPTTSGSSTSGLLWLAPVCAFGFALCPYLDPTFHQVRQANRTVTSRSAFTLGFGAMFPLMILITLFYATWAARVASNLGGLAGVLPIWLAAHVGMQLTYTCTVHALATPGRGPWSAARIGFAMLLAGAAALATAYLPDHAGLQARELVYRSFMAFYGLVFPAYVWLCMIPFGRDFAGTEIAAAPPHYLDRRTLRLFFLTVGIAAPCYWMGFIERQELWLAPGLGIVLLARLFVKPPPN